MKLSPFQPSLRRKIMLSYSAAAFLILGVSAFFFGELRSLEEKVILGQRMSELFDNILEIRRFERNFFLHGQEADHQENTRFIVKTRDVLEANRTGFIAFETPQRLEELHSLLGRYERQMAEYAFAGGDPERTAPLEPRVRALGKDIVAIAEAMAGAERRLVQSSLASFRVILIGLIGAAAVAIVAIGQALSRSVVSPLRKMEASVDGISAGRRDTLSMPSRDREIVSITNAFNHMLRELEIRQKHLMRSEKLASLGTMLSGVAHELNNPLSNISSSCQILQEEIGEIDAETQKELLGQIDQQTMRARNIVRSLLDFAREREFRKEAVLLRELVDQTVGFVRGEVPAKVAIRIAVPGDITVYADTQRLQQAFLNLIKNAVESIGAQGNVTIVAGWHDPAGGPGDSARNPGCDVEGAMVDISVTDDGQGIPSEILPRIFDPFFTTKEVGKGMGLGLFIVHEIVEEHDGCISVSSEPGKGTTFRIRLPALVPREQRNLGGTRA